MENAEITATEFKVNMGRYLKQVQETKSPINITKNGKVVATVSPPSKEDKLTKLLALQGVIPDEGQTKQSAREDRINERYKSDV